MPHRDPDSWIPGQGLQRRGAQLPPARGDGVPASSLGKARTAAILMASAAIRKRVAGGVDGGLGFLSTAANDSNRKAGREFIDGDEGHAALPFFRRRKGQLRRGCGERPLVCCSPRRNKSWLRAAA